MYRVTGLSQLKRNDCLAIYGRWNHGQEVPIMETGEYHYAGPNASTYNDGDIMVCVGKSMKRTGHYEPQPFYRMLTLDGKTALISKGTRKYFKPLKSKLSEPEQPEDHP